jgi:DNA-binding transcriptional ArsR family regulator
VGEPGFYANIPAAVRYDKRLPKGARLLYAEISALTNFKGYCWATNKYFEDLYDVDESTVRRWIGRLRDCGYIEIAMRLREGKREVESREIRLVVSVGKPEEGASPENPPGGWAQNCAEGGRKIAPQNTTACNTTGNTTGEPFSADDSDETDEAKGEAARETWNLLSNIEERRKYAEWDKWELVRVDQVLRHYRTGEVTKSIENYHEALGDSDYHVKFHYRGLVNFLLKGLAQFLDPDAVDELYLTDEARERKRI